jgi:hypothetical protein
MNGPYGLLWLIYEYTEYLLAKHTLSLSPSSLTQMPAKHSHTARGDIGR